MKKMWTEKLYNIGLRVEHLNVPCSYGGPPALAINIRQGWKWLSETKKLNPLAKVFVTKKKSFITLTPKPIFIKKLQLSFANVYDKLECFSSADVSKAFSSKAGAYHSEACFRSFTLGCLLALTTNIRQG
jgi:hypothetical protein